MTTDNSHVTSGSFRRMWVKNVRTDVWRTQTGKVMCRPQMLLPFLNFHDVMSVRSKNVEHRQLARTVW